MLDVTERIEPMTQIEVVPSQVDLTTLSLDELELEANDIRRQGEEALQGALLYFLRWGEVLLEIQERVGRSNWKSWCLDRDINPAWANKCMRVAYHRSSIPPEAFAPYVDRAGHVQSPGLNTVWRMYVKGLAPISSMGRIYYSEEHRQEARRLRAQGMLIKDIAEVLGTSPDTVSRWLDARLARRYEAKRERKRRETIAARKALEEKRQRSGRDALARQTGGELSKSYSLVRQALAALDKVATPGSTDAISHLHKAEEAIVAEMKRQTVAA